MSHLTDIIGVSLPTIRSWLKKGLPYVQAGSNGKEWIFDPPNAIQWRLTKQQEEALMTSGAYQTSSFKPRSFLSKITLG